MLRLIVLVLLVLNVGVYARGQGWLQAYGWGPTPQREPQRLAQQIHPEALLILPSAAASAPAARAPVVPDGAQMPAAAASAAAASAAAAASVAQAASEPQPTACWQVADIEPAQVGALRALLQGNFAEGAWVLDELGLAERWMVYMGKYPNPDDLAKKREQLTQLKVPFSVVTSAAWGSGLSLGVFSAQEGANSALQELTRRGVRSARVVQERPSSQHYRLRLPAIKLADQPALEKIKSALPGKTLEACPTTALAPGASAAR